MFHISGDMNWHLSPPACAAITVSSQNQYIDDLEEYLLGRLSCGLTTAGWDSFPIAALLTEICCGRFPDLWDTWRQGHSLPADTEFSPGPLVDEITSLIMSLSGSQRGLVIPQLLGTVFRTGDIGAGNEILSLLITRNPDFSACLGSVFTWEKVSVSSPLGFLGRNSNRTEELLEGCGADPNCILYYRMASVREITYWEEVLE